MSHCSDPLWSSILAVIGPLFSLPQVLQVTAHRHRSSSLDSPLDSTLHLPTVLNMSHNLERPRQHAIGIDYRGDLQAAMGTLNTLRGQ